MVGNGGRRETERDMFHHRECEVGLEDWLNMPDVHQKHAKVDPAMQAGS
eukprot:CAMPEP_0184649994 /NCGR_PEP_ID=MMETSP0308-20130426/7478_1 /TAXON_ID=38269 /ORGANISM="Gloeochaete witrockiana, Strain SAG 46.84" /LENGTH=48 /DNA_ID= /DNA_START= /DNA_END= /DNA_ORIENTATION=